MSWRDLVLKFDEREVASRVQKTGYCRKCQQMITKYERCPLRLPSPEAGIKPYCPMRGEEI